MAQPQPQPSATVQLDKIQHEWDGRQGFRQQAFMQFLLYRTAVSYDDALKWYTELLKHDNITDTDAITAAFKTDIDRMAKVLQITADLDLTLLVRDGTTYLTVRRVDPGLVDPFPQSTRKSIGKLKTEKTVQVFVELFKLLRDSRETEVGYTEAVKNLRSSIKDFSRTEIETEIANLVSQQMLMRSGDDSSKLKLGPVGEAERMQTAE